MRISILVLVSAIAVVVPAEITKAQTQTAPAQKAQAQTAQKPKTAPAQTAKAAASQTVKTGAPQTTKTTATPATKSVATKTAAPAVKKPIAKVAPKPAPKPSEVSSIDPGMTQAQVVAKLGSPNSTRSYQGYTYLEYPNGCEKTCGMSDIVTLDSGKVVDAVFRSPARKYTGTSSSPHMISADAAAKHPATDEPIKMPAKPAPAPKKPETPHAA